MLPDTRKHVTSKQSDQKQQHDKHTQPCFLFPGSFVMIRDYSGSSKWIPGVILKKLGPVTYDVETTNGRIVKRNVDQLRLRKDSANISEVITTPEISDVLDNHQYPASGEVAGQQDSPMSTEPLERRYPQRVRRPPDRYVPSNDEHSNS